MKNLLIILAFLPLAAQAQYLTGIATRYDDSFVEWNFFSEDEEEGELKMRWQLQDDWTQWDYRFEDAIGNIEMKWRDNPNEWELRGNNKIVTARTLWNGDFKEWRISNSDFNLTLRTRWNNQLDEWELRDGDHGTFRMLTAWERDPRDWVIEDGLDEEVSFEMKLMLVFLVVFNSSPKQ